MVDETVLVESIDGIGTRLRDGEFSVRELTEASLDRLEQVGPELNALVTLTRDRALEAADRLDDELDAGEDRGPLHGIPFGAKDLIAVEGHPTTWGAASREDQRLDETATVIERLEAAGAVLVGKLSTVELAGGLGYDQPDAAFTGPGINPWNRDAWSGGSSCGPGSAVPAGLVGFAVGSETWGSIVSPAAYSGVAGLRPTYGRVSRHGAMALSWTMDKLGPLCRTARGAEHVVRAIAGPDTRDSTTVDRPLFGRLPEDPTLAVIEDAADEVQPAVRENFEVSLSVLEGFATIETVSLPDYPYQAAARTVISGEAAAAFDDFVEAGEAAELRAPADRVGAYAVGTVLAKDYINAMRLRRKLTRELDELFSPYDAVVAPSRPTVAVPLDASFEEYREDFEGTDLPAAANLAGLPGVTVPNGFGERDLPTGIAFTGRAFDDLVVLELAAEYQERTDHVNYADLLDLGSSSR